MIPVSAGREGQFLFVFLLQYIVGITVISLLWWRDPSIDYLEAAKLLTPLIILATAHSVIIVEGIPMLAERFLKRKYNEGKAVGVAEGKAVGVANQNRAWEEWLKRKKEVEGNGELFDEPMPSMATTPQKD